MPEFYLPYHFVPIAEVPKIAEEAADGVRHDCYLPGKRSGAIKCTVTARSPIFIGDQKDDNSKVVSGFKLNGQPALPASSLRGMISSVAEASSNSALRVLSRTVLGEECYSFRKPMRDALTAIGRLSKKNEKWELEPVCLPILQCDTRGSLTPGMRKWETVFSAGPTFRVHYGSSSDIRNPVWAGKALTSPISQIPLHDLKWSDLRPLGAKALKHLNIKTNPSGQSIVAQKETPGEPLTPVITRILGCYEFHMVNGAPEYFRAIPDNKKHELHLPYVAARHKKLIVPPVVMDKFQQLADQMTEQSEGELSRRPYEPKQPPSPREKNGILVPREGDLVFFSVNDAGNEVTEIAYSSIWRGHAGSGPWNFFPGLTPMNPGRKSLTIAERIFGFVEEKDGKELKNGRRLKGRVRFAHGLAINPIRVMGQVPLKELSSPKPPSPALYFHKTKAGGYVSKMDLMKPGTCSPNGRKRYLHHPEAINGKEEPWVNSGAFELKRHVKIKPWAKGSEWKFEIRFDNLDDTELGLLLYSLRPTNSFLHKIGMGRPLGLGSIEVTVDRVSIINRQTRYTSSGWDAERFEATLDWEPLRKTFRDGMKPEIRQALETLGDPSKSAGHEITYPRVEGPDQEKLYQWFVSNDAKREANEFLKPVTAEIPTLNRLRPPRQT